MLDIFSRMDRVARGCQMLVAVLLLFVLVGPARARIFGHGDRLCLDYIEEMGVAEVGRMYVSWAQGYFSSVSYREGLSDFTRGMGSDPSAMGAWLRRYCERHNSKKFYEAVDAFTEELINHGGQKPR